LVLSKIVPLAPVPKYRVGDVLPVVRGPPAMK